MSLQALVKRGVTPSLKELVPTLEHRVHALRSLKGASEVTNPAAHAAAEAAERDLVAFAADAVVTPRVRAAAALGDEAHVRLTYGNAVLRLRQRARAYGDLAAGAERATLASRKLHLDPAVHAEGLAFGRAARALAELGDALDRHVAAIWSGLVPAAYMRDLTHQITAPAHGAFKVGHALYRKGIGAARQLISR